MSNKKFKIKPKVWPKEYTFEEFKQLNPNISENLLINYYNKYLQEYAENHSRHINHFNDTKDKLSTELNLLNERLVDNITENLDYDKTVGPTAAGRFYHEALKQDIFSVSYDGVDDMVYLDENNPKAYTLEGSTTGSPLRPLDAFTIMVWYKNPTGYQDQSAPNYRLMSCFAAGGFHLQLFNTKFEGVVAIDDGDGTKTNITATSVNTHTLEQEFIPGTDTNLGSDSSLYPRVYGHPAKKGWHQVVLTFDNKTGNPTGAEGKYTASIKLFVDGEIANKRGTLAAPITDTSNHGFGSATDEYYNSAGLNKSGSKGSIFYDGQDGVNPGRMKWAPGIGSLPSINNTTGLINGFASSGTGATQSIAEIAFWNRALDENAIKDLYNGIVSSSKGARYDLNYKGNLSGLGYDVLDEGLDYTTVGKYADNLQLWYTFEEPVSSSVAIDSSGNGHHGTYRSLPAISDESYNTYPGE